MYKPAPITSFSMWMQAWNTYLTVLLSHNPACALELVGYQRIITSASHTFPLKAYDGQFHTMAASNPTLVGTSAIKNCGTKTCPIPTLHNDGHALNVGLRTNCPHSPFRDSLQRSIPPNRRTSGALICGGFG